MAFIDNFNDGTIDSTYWEVGNPLHGYWTGSGVTFAETGGVLQITPTSSNSTLDILSLKTKQPKYMYGQTVSVKVPQVVAGADSIQFMELDSSTSGGRWVWFGMLGGTIYKNNRDATGEHATSLGAYNASVHVYFRFRHDVASNTLYYEYSTDGSSWTVMTSTADIHCDDETTDIAINLKAVKIGLGAGTVGSVASPGLAKFDDFTLSLPTLLEPSGLSAIAANSTTIDLNWSDNSSAETDFRVERAPDVSGSPGTFVQINVTAANATTYQDTGLSPGTKYHYRVRASDGTTFTAYSNIAYATTPSAGGNLVFNEDFNDGTTMPASMIGATFCRGYFSAWVGVRNIGGTSMRIYQTGVPNTGNPVWNWSHEWTEAGGAKFKSCMDMTDGFADTEISTLPPANANILAGIQFGMWEGNRALIYYKNNAIGLKCFYPDETTQTATEVTWNATDHKHMRIRHHSSDDTIRLWTSPDATTWTQRASLPRNGILLENARVELYAEWKNGPTTPGYAEFNYFRVETPKIGRPYKLSGSAYNHNTVDMQWDNQLVGAENLFVERSTTSGSAGFGLVGTVSGTADQFTDNSASPSTTYWYRVRALASGAYSLYSNVISVTTPASAPSIMPPTCLWVFTNESTVTLAGGTSVVLRFKANATNEGGYSLERRQYDSGVWSSWAEVWRYPATNGQLYQFIDERTPKASNKFYEYRMRSFMPDGTTYSPYSNVASGNTADAWVPSGNPAGLTATVNSCTEIELSWTHPDSVYPRDDEPRRTMNFMIERSTSNDPTTFRGVADTVQPLMSYKDRAALPSTTYYYRVRAQNHWGYSGYTSIAGPYTTPAQAMPVANIATTPNQLTFYDGESFRLSAYGSQNVNDLPMSGPAAHRGLKPYLWKIDGKTVARLPGLAWAFQDLGEHTVELTVYSNDGVLSHTTSVTINVVPMPWTTDASHVCSTVSGNTAGCTTKYHKPVAGNFDSLLNAGQASRTQAWPIVEVDPSQPVVYAFSLYPRTGTGYCYFRSSRYTELTKNRRVTAADVAAGRIVKLVQASTDVETLTTYGAQNGRYVLHGIGSFQPATPWPHGNSHWVIGDPMQQVLADQAKDFIFKHCYLDGGESNTCIVGHGVNQHASHVSWFDSRIINYKDSADAQAIFGQSGPGCHFFQNSDFQATGENIIYGGGVTFDASPTQPRDLTFYRMLFTKPLAWRDQTYGVVKNIFELKEGERVVVLDSILENCWPHGQGGTPILFTPQDETGYAPWCRVNDVYFRNVVTRRVNGEFWINAVPYPYVADGYSIRSGHFAFDNCLFFDGGELNKYCGKLAHVSNAQPWRYPTFKHITAHSGGGLQFNTGDWLPGEGAPPKLYINDSIFINSYLFNAGGPFGKAALDFIFPSSYFIHKSLFPNINLASYDMTLLDVEAPSTAGVGFENFVESDVSKRDFRLSATSIYRAAGTTPASDGTDHGADITEIKNALGGTSFSFVVGTTKIESGDWSGNQPAVVNAGSDQSLSAGVTSTILTGTATDPESGPVTVAWTRTSGPNTPTIVSPTSLTTAVNGMVAGTYVFRLTATDDQSQVTYDEMSVTIASSNLPPIVNAGSDQNLTAVTTSTTLTGTATDPEGQPMSRTWTRQSGPNVPTIVSPTSLSTNVTGLIPGVYVFRLTVNDGTNTVFDEVTVRVNRVPTVNAGSDQSLSTGTTSTTLSGSASDLDSDPLSYAWTRVSGPNTPTIVSPTSVSTNVTGLVTGTYVFRLTVNDGINPAVTDDVTVAVAVNLPPTVNAGADQNLASGTTSTTLTGTASDPEGATLTKTWTRQSGPNTPTIVSPNNLSTNVTGMVSGTYVFKLTVNDGVNPDVADTVTVTISSGNAPVISVPNDNIRVQFKKTSVTLSGTATDVDSGSLTYLWTRVSGPNTPTIVSPTSPTTLITGLVKGIYIFRLAVSDGVLTTTKDITVTVPHNRGQMGGTVTKV